MQTEFNRYNINSIENMELMEKLEDENEDFLDSEKHENQYMIGSCYLKPLLFGCAIKPYLFYKYSPFIISRYLGFYTLFYSPRPKIHVIQLKIINNMYIAVLKTIWIKLIQRHWKKTFQQRKDVMKRRRQLNNIHYFERHGNHLRGLNVVPSLRGMLRMYSQNK